MRKSCSQKSGAGASKGNHRNQSLFPISSRRHRQPQAIIKSSMDTNIASFKPLPNSTIFSNARSHSLARLRAAAESRSINATVHHHRPNIRAAILRYRYRSRHLENEVAPQDGIGWIFLVSTKGLYCYSGASTLACARAGVWDA